MAAKKLKYTTFRWCAFRAGRPAIFAENQVLPLTHTPFRVLISRLHKRPWSVYYWRAESLAQTIIIRRSDKIVYENSIWIQTLGVEEKQTGL